MWVFFSFSRRGRHLRGGDSTVFSPEMVIRNELALPTGKTSEALFTSHTNYSQVSEPSLRRAVVSHTLPYPWVRFAAFIQLGLETRQ